jgi:hypothetical protein
VQGAWRMENLSKDFSTITLFLVYKGVLFFVSNDLFNLLNLGEDLNALYFTVLFLPDLINLANFCALAKFKFLVYLGLKLRFF